VYFLDLLTNLSASLLSLTQISNLYRIFGRDGNCAVLLYHRVCPNEEVTSYDKAVAVSPAAFERQIGYLRSSYTPVSLAQLIDALAGGKALPPRAVHVTFDDAYVDLYKYAVPVLMRYSMPATVFVPVNKIETGESFWWDELGALLRDASAVQISTEFAGRSLCLDLRNQKSKAKTFSSLIRVFQEDENAVQAFLDGLRRKLAPLAGCFVSQILSWSQIVEMATNGIEIGSHTLSHARLAALDEHKLQVELVKSKELLESILQKEVASIAYPYGREFDFDSRTMHGSRSAGYRIAFSGVQGLARPGENLYSVRRVPIRGTDTMGVFKAKVSGSFPILYSFSRRSLGILRAR
jgi:peptidoglycan/xylan/chitin deacetylase (PgdA/CDA1 family)